MVCLQIWRAERGGMWTWWGLGWTLWTETVSLLEYRPFVSSTTTLLTLPTIPSRELLTVCIILQNMPLCGFGPKQVLKPLLCPAYESLSLSLYNQFHSNFFSFIVWALLDWCTIIPDANVSLLKKIGSVAFTVDRSTSKKKQE